MASISPTQRALSPDDTAEYLRASFGRDRRVADCAALGGGGFAAVWWARLDNGRQVVLKVAPPPTARLLRYETDLLAAEARYFRLVAAHAPQVPVPPVLHHGRDPRLGEWLVTGRLPGRALPDLDDADDLARYDFGAAMATLHRITGDRFGYDAGRTGGATWSTAFAAIIEDLLADAADWDITLPAPPQRFRALVARHADLLDEIRRPALLHFDGWDGNVLAAPDGTGAYRMCGLVDGERFLYGDPLLDLVSPLLFRRAEEEPEHPFLRGYADAVGTPLVFDEGVRRRLALYRMHLHLLMTVEMPSRGITPANDPGRHARLAELLERDLADLAAG
ncbi:phosphotransferase family protein [Micromonospora endophytica]|uniref:Aminoglycoside phosphotransferase family protein n=1 Tax=Micromonospora endophytica TaxID=515350 RepID=A0A2W2CKB4_9ACTN|nr:aminoglycoside phosphotransferase family protein [Micromonospora endophytica]PZF99911.1 aminoglycoside phosphotransferase family protein [Micromonospora endophytica]RIW49506.1 aminoglycoside phosphotransferase family protein [Micromonospora endophytica]